MAAQQYKEESHVFNAGPLGWLEGLSLSDASNGAPVCKYFGGIPYGSIPERFRRAQRLPQQSSLGTKHNPGQHTTSASVCPQPGWRGPPDQTRWNENCSQLNIYMPFGTAPKDGWPVFFYIHGGFLQWGSPNFPPSSMAPLMQSAFKAILVVPAYRLNALGFISSHEFQAEANANNDTVGNLGFWDQRLALEWTSDNIQAFNGNPKNITVGGYSAGSHSTFQQLAHELYFVSDQQAIIKRAIMWSNSPGVQPKTIDEHQKQFNELLTVLDIPLSLPANQKLQRLRAVPQHRLVSAQNEMKISEFRALSDGHFISKTIIADINSGDFARRMKARGITLMNGECEQEHSLYEAWRTPTESYEAVYTRLCGDYPEAVVRKLMDYYCGKSRALPGGARNWADAFGKLYANMQVHCLERGFHAALEKGGLTFGKDVLRYRFNWRVSGLDAVYPPSWGVTHATDMAIWLFGLDCDGGLTDDERRILRPWNEAFAAFVRGDEVNWGTNHVKQMRRLRADGVTDIWVDDRWEEGLEVWSEVNNARIASKL
ncbi:related to triacylglycerol lipase V precursor [Ramularia collo-cygni]|uniref:Related to triacylglycerol lipase V n=1 Tax=Ramularia collo-cygni TaxID=112498 RepID=A0A2D3VC21_9PEZI|nr:related to triacylglycerol lipase V precursor [Ramularia collo-cygni]CZT22357.1 related to triacylglycerol lipase V precursor [Ramularia collo-cygni]